MATAEEEGIGHQYAYKCWELSLAYTIKKKNRKLDSEMIQAYKIYLCVQEFGTVLLADEWPWHKAARSRRNLSHFFPITTRAGAKCYRVRGTVLYISTIPAKLGTGTSGDNPTWVSPGLKYHSRQLWELSYKWERFGHWDLNKNLL